MIILPNDGLDASAIEALKKEGFEVLDNKVAQEQLVSFINDNQVNVLLVRSATQVRKDIIDNCPSLKIIGRAGVGMDNIDVEYAREKGLHVINTPGASAKSVGELVMAHMFAMARFLHDANRKMPLEGDKNFKSLKKSYASATELEGKTLGIIGFGKIGQATAKLALGLGMKVIAHDKFIENAVITLNFYNGTKVDFNIETTDMDTILKESDFISLHVPKQNEYILGAAEFEKMKDTAFIINTARGGTVDEVALVKALDEGKISGAALDVFESEPTPEVTLLMNEKLSLTPHVGGSTQEAQERIGMELVDQIIQINNA